VIHKLLLYFASHCGHLIILTPSGTLFEHWRLASCCRNVACAYC